MVNSEDEEEMALQTPRGALATATNMQCRGIPGSTPGDPMGHPVSRSEAANMVCFLFHMMGVMAGGRVRRLKCSSCQGFT